MQWWQCHNSFKARGSYKLQIEQLNGVVANGHSCNSSTHQDYPTQLKIIHNQINEVPYQKEDATLRTGVF